MIRSLIGFGCSAPHDCLRCGAYGALLIGFGVVVLLTGLGWTRGWPV